MKEFKVMASSMSATYTSGKFVAETADEAIQLAKENYRNGSLGKSLKDVGAFRFYVVDSYPYESDED